MECQAELENVLDSLSPPSWLDRPSPSELPYKRRGLELIRTGFIIPVTLWMVNLVVLDDEAYNGTNVYDGECTSYIPMRIMVSPIHASAVIHHHHQFPITEVDPYPSRISYPSRLMRTGSPPIPYFRLTSSKMMSPALVLGT